MPRCGRCIQYMVSWELILCADGVYYTQCIQCLLRACWCLCLDCVYTIVYVLYKVSSDQTVHAVGVYSIVYYVYYAESVESCWLLSFICVEGAHRSRGSKVVYNDENCILCVLIHCIVYIVHSRDPYTSSLEKRDLYTSSLESRVVCSAERSSLCRWPWLTISSVALAVLLLKQWPF